MILFSSDPVENWLVGDGDGWMDGMLVCVYDFLCWVRSGTELDWMLRGWWMSLLKGN